MSSSFELNPVSRITAGAVGEPGQRTFFIQARRGDVLVTLLAEKQQIQVLSATLAQLLEGLDEIDDEGTPPAEGELELEEPLLPEWRVGPMAIEVDESTGLIVLIAQEAVAGTGEDDDEDDEQDIVEEPPGGQARFVATRAQMRALAEHADEVVGAGRPRCQLCGFPIDPDGHVCPAQNGHRKLDV